MAETGYVTGAEKEGWIFNADNEKGWHDVICQDWRFPGFVQTENEPVTLDGSGSYDPDFGNTTADFATQYRILSYPDYGTNPIVDSV